MTAPTPTYFKRVFGPNFCPDCGQEGCRPVSVCCGAEECGICRKFPSDGGRCQECHKQAGFECDTEAVTA